ncbi:hypothetical protein [Deinococcus wulumuqiensis]|uniref:Uncharacterized protein n=1 Tax=Deinococcus wulumuqiensis TaxID=980427 RepID=A0AAV4K1H4_9DEIO|nr:hypothetical protein [Deinococcus wulumuqiensis]QII20191.1 hypothetical protein G6R31_04970 [Deinococcus wulumuqiensis R12]GGI75328.1 hypothetical protein GCM10010914_06930 [Deinococcus wulumuqiensis]GGP28709.1 hypothetical protein GCM10008021_03600 [Deinococcus wulumuqiensis]
MLPIREIVDLSTGAVTLRAWGAHVADAYLIDLLKITATLAALREHWQDFRREDIERELWPAYWRLVQASLDGCTLPRNLNWHDRLLLLDAMWQLNDIEASEGKLKALEQRAAQRLARVTQLVQGQLTTAPQTPPLTSS